MEGLVATIVLDQAVGTGLTSVHKFPNPKTSHTVFIADEYDALGFSWVGQEVESNGEES